jgi:hypothetical protein
VRRNHSEARWTMRRAGEPVVAARLPV